MLSSIKSEYSHRKYSKIGKIVQLYGCHGKENAFCQCFSCGPDKALLDRHFGVLCDPCRRPPPQKPSVGARKYSKIGRIVQFYGCHGNQNVFCQRFSCGSNRDWLDGHFGVLHDPCWGLPAPNPWCGSRKILKSRPNHPVLWLPW